MLCRKKKSNIGFLIFHVIAKNINELDPKRIHIPMNINLITYFNNDGTVESQKISK